MDKDVEELRRDPSPMNGLGVTEVVDHYAAIVSGLDRPPILMGHLFGGLITEMLLDRGLGACGVAISPAQIKGVLRLPPAQIKATFPVLNNPANRKRTVELTPKQFHYNFTNTMGDEDAQAAYDRYEVPGPGRVLFEAAFANFNPHAPTKVDFHKDDRAPLLVIGNDEDHTVPASGEQGGRAPARKVEGGRRLQGVPRTAALHCRRAGLGRGGGLRARLGGAPHGCAGARLTSRKRGARVSACVPP
jgi:hypothetical protein